MPAKLRLLGFDRADPDASIVDLCCGCGEALDALHEMGFRRLTGLDLEIPAPLAADARFQVCAGDACHTGLPDASFDWALNIHSMHHFRDADTVAAFLAEAYRILKPGGRLSIIDFPNSPQIRLAFWFFRRNVGLWTPYLRNFGSIIQEEWSFLKSYLPQWPKVRALLHDGPFEVESEVKQLFYFYLTLRKPSGR